MGRGRQRAPEGVDPEEAARIQRALDRLDERLLLAPAGLHRAGRPAEPAAWAAVGLPPTAAMFWARYDGLEIGAEMARVHAVSQILAATRAADAEGLLKPGDRVIGEAGRDLYVLPEDPYEEGAEVVLVEEGGERLPEASTVVHLALGLVGENALLTDEQGEFRDEIIGEDGELTAAMQRRVLRRRLDLDPDAPRPRLRLAQGLLEAGELRAAASELRQVLRRAPELAWAHETLARVREAQADAEGARRAYLQAATLMERQDVELAAYFRTRAAQHAEGEARAEIVARVREARPGFAREQVEAATALLERGAIESAREVITLGLLISPGHLELLGLRQALEAGTVDRVGPAEDDEPTV